MGGPCKPNSLSWNLVLGMPTVTSLRGRQPELVQEVERFRLDIIRFTSMQGLGSGTQFLVWMETLPLTSEAPAPSPGAKVHADGKRGCIFFFLWVGDKSLNIVLAYRLKSSPKYLVFWVSLGGGAEKKSTPMWAMTVPHGGVGLEGIASLIWTLVVLCC